MKISKILIAAGIAGCCGAGPARAAQVDFKTQVQPIFESACLKCHGPEKQKGGLRLDSKAAAFKGGKDGAVLVPGAADKSDLYRRIILPASSDDVMPSKGDLLTKTQTDAVRDWINQGANWPEGAMTGEAEQTPAASVSDYDALPPFTPGAGEAAAIAKLQATGITALPIAANSNWREVNLHNLGTNINDASIAPLKDMASIVDLNLAGTKITDAGLQTVAGLTNLVHLHLERTAITDTGLEHLKNLSHLVYLNLYGTGVTDAGVAQLKSLRALKHLYVWQTKITASGVEQLQHAAPGLEISRGWANEPAAKTAEAKPASAEENKAPQ
jgi:mono/diheme cytochrome c family protein